VLLRLAIRHKAELGKWWAERVCVAVPWVSRSGLFGVEVVFEDASYSNRVSTIRRGLAEVEEVHGLLNTEPVVGLQLHDGAVQWLRGWAMALQKEAVKQKAVEKARRTELCRF
jgi:hypothetical protein